MSSFFGKNKIPGNFHFIHILKQAPVFLKIMVILLSYKSWFRHLFSSTPFIFAYHLRRPEPFL